MAGDWIKMRSNLHEDPRVISIAAELDTDELHVVGMLWRVWSWADCQSLDGRSLSITEAFLDRIVMRQGFALSLRKAGWLEGADKSLAFPRFTEHNGQTAKSRSDTQKRVAEYRARKDNVTTSRYKCNDKEKIPSKLRNEVFTRDGFKCVYCDRNEGETSPTESKTDGYLCADHVIPECDGGATHERNLVACCNKCNREKAHRDPERAGMKWPIDVSGIRYGCNKKPLPEKRREDRSPIVPKGDIQLRAEALVKRRVETPLGPKDQKAFKAAWASLIATTDEQWLAIEAFYRAPQETTFARKDLVTLLNNWNGEIDRATAWVAKNMKTAEPELKYV